MKLPADVADSVSRLAGPIGPVNAVGGGCISSAARISIEGRPLMLKFEHQAPSGFFGAEAAGLLALAEAGSGLRVPDVIGTADPSARTDWILIEWLEDAGDSLESSRQLGAGLAKLHRSQGDFWGWERDGFIGRLPQANDRQRSWAEFWWTRRLAPQLERSGPGPVPREKWESLRRALPEILAPAEAEGSSLLHGDLWGGNVLHSTEGPALIDPACYWGHREVDLAMAELFGGFSSLFFRVYEDEWSLAPGWRIRRLIYQLYYLLVHVNLFGESYWSRTASTLAAALDSHE